MGWLALRGAVAALGAALVAVAYVVCIALAKARDTYTGGMAMPYFSDTGRDKPAYYVFASMIGTACILFIVFFALQYVYMRRYFAAANRAAGCRNATALVFGIPGAICGVLLAVFSTSDSATIHNLSAYIFFVCIIIWTTINMSMYGSLSAVFQQHRRRNGKRWLVFLLLVVAFIIYIPVGLALVTWEELLLEDCWEQLSLEYCEEHWVEGTNETDLFDYSNDLSTNLMRSSSQFVCIISIMLFILLAAGDPALPDMDGSGSAGDSAAGKADQQAKTDSEVARN